jgi:hypothetical protein
VRGVSKTLVAALAVFLLVVGLAACGGGDSSSSTSAEAENGASAQNAATNGDESKAGSDAEGKAGSSAEGENKSSANDERTEAKSFAPKHHKDSGGGSQQYVVKGGDNSVQEFGEEADSTEFNAAAVALHNFLDARAEGNWGAACTYMAKEIVESFEKLASRAKQVEATTCSGILQALTNPAAKQSMKAEAEKANVGSLRIEGERSFVIYTGIEGTILAMPMVNEGGDWKVASLAGTPLN